MNSSATSATSRSPVVVEVEALALSEDAVAHLEDLGVGVGALRRDTDQIGRADRAAGDPLALEKRADRLEAIAVQRGALVVALGGRLLHLALLLPLDLAVAAGEEVDDRLDVAAVLVAVDVADAGGPAALDEVVEAGIAGAPARLGPFAGAVLEQLAEQVEGLPHPLCAGERPEVGAARPVALPGEVDAREFLVEADPDVGVGLVVPQADVETGPVALDEALLGEQSLGLVRGDQELDPVNPAGHLGLAAGEVGSDPLADRAGLADVEDLPPRAVEDVDAGRIRQAAALLGDPLRPRALAVVFAHRVKG